MFDNSSPPAKLSLVGRAEKRPKLEAVLAANRSQASDPSQEYSIRVEATHTAAILAYLLESPTGEVEVEALRHHVHSELGSSQYIAWEFNNAVNTINRLITGPQLGD